MRDFDQDQEERLRARLNQLSSAMAAIPEGSSPILGAKATAGWSRRSLHLAMAAALLAIVAIGGGTLARGSRRTPVRVQVPSQESPTTTSRLSGRDQTQYNWDHNLPVEVKGGGYILPSERKVQSNLIAELLVTTDTTGHLHGRDLSRSQRQALAIVHAIDVRDPDGNVIGKWGHTFIKLDDFPTKLAEAKAILAPLGLAG